MALDQPPPGFFDDERAEGFDPANDASDVPPIPRHDDLAERSILGNVLYDGGRLDELRDMRPEHLFSEAHRRIFEAIRNLRGSGTEVTAVTVANALKCVDRLAQVGGTSYLTELVGSTAVLSEKQLAAHLAIVVGHSTARQTAAVCDRAAALVRTGSDAAATLAQTIEYLGALQAAPTLASELLDGAAIAAPLPAIDYLVREIGLVAGGGAPHLIAGYGFSGKTLAVQSLALSLASGQPVWGSYPTRNPRRVLHVDLEQGDRLTRRRYQRLARAMGLDLRARGDALSLIVMPAGLTLTAACADRWRSLMHGRDLVIVDSLRAANAGQDENDSGIRSGLDMLGALSEATGCRALVIHHARKQGQDDPGGRYAIRGSSAIFDGVDSAYLFSAEKDEPVSVENIKARSHGELVEDLALVVSDVESEGEPRAGLRIQVHGAELVKERREARQDAAAKAQGAKDAGKVRDALGKKPGINTTELRGVTRLSGDRLAAALLELGQAVEVRTEAVGRTRVNRHFLRGSP
jgi:hypothetical protein